MSDKQNTTRTLLTVKQFSEKHPSFSEGSLRHIIFYAETNGFQKCIRRIGRKVLLDEDIFFQCTDEQNQRSAGL